MTRILLIHRFWLLRLSLLSCLLVVAGCSGSRLGDTVGKSLEPDPQLADNGGAIARNSASETAGTEPPENDSSATEPADGEPEASANDQPDSEADAPAAGSDAVTAGDYTDLGKAPEELQDYLVDLIELELLEVRSLAAPPASSASNSDNGSANNSANNSGDSDESNNNTPPPPKPAPATGPDEFRPNQATTRREYARWLLAVNNRFYDGQRNRRIRAGVTSSRPVFQDVPVSDPDFAAIQGLAEAGIIPSPLTGSSTTLTFRPDAPLTRKDLLLWKVPLDTRQALPQATPEAVEQAWGFQDAGKIEPRALQAVLADYQNGDFANIRRALGYTTLFQPDKAATRAETAAVLWRFGNSTEGITAAEIRNPTAAEPDASSGAEPDE